MRNQPWPPAGQGVEIGRFDLFIPQRRDRIPPRIDAVEKRHTGPLAGPKRRAREQHGLRCKPQGPLQSTSLLASTTDRETERTDAAQCKPSQRVLKQTPKTGNEASLQPHKRSGGPRTPHATCWSKCVWVIAVKPSYPLLSRTEQVSTAKGLRNCRGKKLMPSGCHLSIIHQHRSIRPLHRQATFNCG